MVYNIEYYAYLPKYFLHIDFRSDPEYFSSWAWSGSRSVGKKCRILIPAKLYCWVLGRNRKTVTPVSEWGTIRFIEDLHSTHFFLCCSPCNHRRNWPIVVDCVLRTAGCSYLPSACLALASGVILIISMFSIDFRLPDGESAVCITNKTLFYLLF